ncbi:hypothetical protein CO180_04580 [candidate division WWE3 bacterium CG_4_9_14_3_um_filter_41_6]|uniref:Ribulose-phosphate 3-epimerase n=1 Tax=candidate division WWE3 bacterium CG_4_10_14_0_2_um_filter_41_14 TaxID=1975072 RepID=A0A2M7TK18_UNCKA|nr:MAG: hypothetical protein COY32_02245 [candidate division WWE3 bacterium CG_4_10_14_0_2_um_filter_41_14]PJA37949.1 MAG: hypothetical protein CO180_04580 [candidate division WWE3 bacterium CG_4_9_14_3_um_filter_41_6]
MAQITNIIPALLTNSISELTEDIDKVSDVVDLVQIDVVDGYFAPYITCCPAPQIAAAEIDMPYEVHLMVEDPITMLNGWRIAGAERVIGQIEKMPDQEAFVKKASDLGLGVGLALTLKTPISDIAPALVNSLDLVLLMAHEVGVQGVSFDDIVLEKISQLHTLYPNLIIEVDGGIDEETIVKAHNSGASRFAVGSTIINSDDPQAMIQKLASLIR